MKKILIADSLDKEAVDLLKAVPGFEVTVKTGMDEAALVQTVPGFNAVVVRSATKITKPVIEASSGLEIVVRAGIGLDNVDSAAAKAKGVAVANTPAATTISVAEYTFGLMLGAVRQLGQANVGMKQHKWEKKALHGTELYGKTLGLIGAGRIGLAVAERAIAFGMTVLAYDVVPIQTALAVRQVTLDELLAQADLITLHIPKTQGALLGPGRVRQDEGRASSWSMPPAAASWTRRPSRPGSIPARSGPPPSTSSPRSRPRIGRSSTTPTSSAAPHIASQAEEGQKRAGLDVVRILKDKLA